MSKRVTMQLQGRVAVLAMDDGKVNAMQDAFFADMNAALDAAQTEGARAVVFAGREGCFSAGLDMKTLPTLPAPQLRATLGTFAALMLRVYLLEQPAVAAITGHAIAGGAVLSLACDRRVMARAPFKIGLNEVPLGINLPAFVVDFARGALPVAHLTEAVIHGQLFEAERAREVGFVEETVDPPAQTLERALAIAGQLAALPPAAYAHAKRHVREPVIERSRAKIDEELDGFMTAFRPAG